MLLFGTAAIVRMAIEFEPVKLIVPLQWEVSREQRLLGQFSPEGIRLRATVTLPTVLVKPATLASSIKMLPLRRVNRLVIVKVTLGTTTYLIAGLEVARTNTIAPERVLLPFKALPKQRKLLHPKFTLFKMTMLVLVRSVTCVRSRPQGLFETEKTGSPRDMMRAPNTLTTGTPAWSTSPVRTSPAGPMEGLLTGPRPLASEGFPLCGLFELPKTSFNRLLEKDIRTLRLRNPILLFAETFRLFVNIRKEMALLLTPPILVSDPLKWAATRVSLPHPMFAVPMATMPFMTDLTSPKTPPTTIYCSLKVP